MKKNVIKTAIAIVCLVAAGLGGMKAYNVANPSSEDALLTENVEALSSGDCGVACGRVVCKPPSCSCYVPGLGYMIGQRGYW